MINSYFHFVVLVYCGMDSSFAIGGDMLQPLGGNVLFTSRFGM